MVTGETGKNGLAAPKPVDQGQEADQESVTTQLQLMEAETVRDQAMSQEVVTKMFVQLRYVLVFIFISLQKDET